MRKLPVSDGWVKEHCDRCDFTALIEVGLGCSLWQVLTSLTGQIASTGQSIAHSQVTVLFLFVVRGVLVSLVILPPTILMGSTLPLFCRQFVRSDTKVANSVGMLYGVKYLGSGGGLCSSWALIASDTWASAHRSFGAALNVLCGIAVGLLPLTKSQPPQLDQDRRQAGNQDKTAVARFTAAQLPITILFFLVGFVALGGEVLWTRYLRLLTRQNSVYTIP